MNQRDLARTLAKKFFLPQRQSVRLLHFLTDRIAETLARGDRLTLHHFGVFHRAHRAAKTVRHPKTGKLLTLPARHTAAFRPAPALEKQIQ